MQLLQPVTTNGNMESGLNAPQLVEEVGIIIMHFLHLERINYCYLTELVCCYYVTIDN